ncbi:hypothetical protein SLS56_011336 [Neofusicoccum ribis]|uniref:non-specific serine/threonine protein kinase n=1 Tax=Neofusicoccum ribis TaxID=45134 RepID=A0ABR3SBW4_9PEZI
MLRAEVERNLIIDHPQVFDAYFRQVAQLSDIATAVFERCSNADPPMYTKDVGWTDWPPSCKEDEVLGFLRRHLDQFLLFANEQGFQPLKRRRCVTAPNHPLAGSVGKRKLAVGIARSNSSESEDEEPQCNWSHILVPGELKSNPQKDSHNDTWLDISRYVREVFASQDTRQFVLGFALCGSIMRLWEIDRLGGVGSTSFNINTDGSKFVSMMLGFLWMNEEELGFDPIIIEGDDERVYIAELMKWQRSIAGRATTCWKGYIGADEPGDPIVIKDSWEYEDRLEEGLLLQEAIKAGVENVARYYHHETVCFGGAVDDVLGSVREGLKDDDGRNLFEHRRTRLCDALVSATTSGHESLASKAKILHRDISSGNVMLNEVEDDGLLIDFDLAVKIDREKASGVPSQELSESKYDSWNSKNTEELAEIKKGKVDEEDKFN